MARAGLALLTALLIVHVLVSASLAASSLHHHALGSDPARNSPDCALCLFAHGKITAEVPTPIVSRIQAIVIELEPVFEPSISAASDHCLSPSRAPPA